MVYSESFLRYQTSVGNFFHFLLQMIDGGRKENILDRRFYKSKANVVSILCKFSKFLILKVTNDNLWYGVPPIGELKSLT